ncbi:rabphilin-3A [Osmerus mordax]|uniref:rabphilin-3A n=1 Tax=Osmerus mordax TaxID=8014 RepID=UPI00350F43FF
MPHQEEDYPGQPVWQSVFLFCCKGMIEGVILLLFLWLLLQVLFTKNLEVHLQILLAVGLAVFCFCLVLGCILCWRRGKTHPPEDKEAALSPHSAVSRHVTVTLTPAPGTLPIKQQYEELDGDVLEYPSPRSSSSPSDDDLSALPFSPLAPCSEMSSSPRSCFPMRRLSTPCVPSSPNKPRVHGRASLPSIPKLSLVSKTRRAIERRCTVSSDSVLCSEHSRLSATAAPPPPVQQGEPAPTQYGSSSTPGSLSILSKTAPILHFSLHFSPGRGTLTTSILGLSGASRRRSGVLVRASLPPLCPSPQQVASSRRRSLSPEMQSQSFVLQVGSVEELRACTLRLAVFSRDFSGLREAALGELEMACREMDWEPDTTITYTRELSPARSQLKKSMSSQETLGRRKSSVCAPRSLGQLYILLQYQTVAHRIKVMVRKAENLAKLTRMPGAPDHYVVINLRQDGKVIGTKETKGAGGHNAVWNAPFLFDLPVGEVSLLNMVLEFIVMQGHVYTKSSMMGRVLIGCEGPEAGQGHWRDMCSRGQVEMVRWHTIQPEAHWD